MSRSTRPLSQMVGGSPHIVAEGLLLWCAWTPLYHVPIPCHPDHSSAVEVFTSWFLFRVKSAIGGSPRVSCAFVRSLREGRNFKHSKSFIMALHYHHPNDLGTGLVDLLLLECVRMSERFPPPPHLYSHQEGTFLDVVPNDVDREAKAQALRQPHPMPTLHRGLTAS